MITHKLQLRSRYNEVDQMGYIYHSNYVNYCHQARTELLRKLGIEDKILEDNKIMLPVISFDIKYLKPAFYDDLLTIKTIIKEIPTVRFNFEFEIFNISGDKIVSANTTVVFVDSKTRLPKKTPDFILKKLTTNFNLN
ncbi:acyl-CoA thioesterase [Lutibacter citreus]|uniref:acyl-CoA thioesterase n=1 Tax=Lutibacter citreus TaxID=2138210 RepID=UPI000DBE37A0|nr:thioesterase family protein [Lutibacter citreus]